MESAKQMKKYKLKQRKKKCTVLNRVANTEIEIGFKYITEEYTKKKNEYSTYIFSNGFKISIGLIKRTLIGDAYYLDKIKNNVK